MKIVIAGGSGHLGAYLLRHFQKKGLDIVVLSRRASSDASAPVVIWDGRTLGPWAEAIDGADVMLNLAGRSVDCRYNEANSREILTSRVESTRVIGQAIGSARHPPKVWLQSSTATIYRHRYDAPNDEATGELGGSQHIAPPKWQMSEDVALARESELERAETPQTRKVALRTAIVMSTERGGAFDRLASLARLGLGGTLGNGRQWMSWIHELDFGRAIEFLIERDDLEGPVNLAAPEPLLQRDFARHLRRALGVKIGLPAPAWLLEIACWAMGTESELVLKSRCVVPARLLAAGFEFEFPHWPEACAELISRWRK